MSSSDSNGESDWNKRMFNAVKKEQGKGQKITEQRRWKQIVDCIEQGANINALDKNGNTVLDIAVIKDYQEVAGLLRQRGAQTARPVKLANDLDNLDIASVLSDDNKQPGEHAGCQSTTASIQSAANDKPSTSGISNVPRRDPATSLVPQLPKHKLLNDNEPDVVPKKRRLILTDTSDHEGGRDDAVCNGLTGPRSETLDTDHDPENRKEIDETSYWDPEEKYAASGLKQTLHGVVYQWKHLMLVLNRARKKGYTFRLSTEMDAAENFDDLVLEYADNAGKKTHRFVQLKHKKDNDKRISARALLDVKDGEFSVLKYFVSWRKIKECSSFDGSQAKTYTLCTNIGLDVEGLSKSNIGVSMVEEPDDFLKIPNRGEQPPRYKLKVSKGSELHNTLKFASDVHRLARELAERVRRSQGIHLNTDIMKRYHAALKQEVVDVKSRKFTTNFIENTDLPLRAQNFRDIFFSHTKKLFRGNASDFSEDFEKEIWNDLEGSELKLSNKFDPKLTHVQQFSDEFVKLVNNAWKDGVVKIDRKIYNKRASNLSIERIFADNIDKLAGHVLVTENGKIRFSSRFLKDVTQLLGNMEEFRNVLKTRLGSQFDELNKFEFEINNSKTCGEEELFPTTELPDDDISDQEILDFLNGFVLAVDQPDEKELGDMIEREIGDDRFDLPDAKFFTDSLQIEMLDWFKETGKQSVFLANKDARDIFDEIVSRLSSLVTMDLRSEYPAKLKKWGIGFRSGNTELWEFIQSLLSPPGQILVISSGQTLLTALRAYQTLESLRKSEPRHGFIFVRLERLFETKILDQILRTFEWRDNHNLLVIDCESICVTRYTHELWNPVCRILTKNTGKKMILIMQDNQDVAVEFRIGYKPVSEEVDNLSIVNLEKSSQQKLLERKVVKFQGQDESFGRLLGIRNFGNIGADELERLRQIIELNVLVQLIKGEEIQIGSEMEGLGPIQNYYIPRRMVRHVVISKDIAEASGMSDLFAISGLGEGALRILLGNTGRIRSFDKNSETESSLSEWIVLGEGEEASNFEMLCERNPNRNIHWLQCAKGKLIWIRSFGVITNLLCYIDVSGVAGDDECSPATVFTNEDELVEFDPNSRIVIISDIAGMGKSSVLTSLAEKMKYEAFRKMTHIESPLLKIKINLTLHTTALNQEREKRTFSHDNIDSAVDFLVDKLSKQVSVDKSSNDLLMTSRVFKTMLKDDGPAAMFFDGFDEISPRYGPIVLDLLQALAKLRMKRIFVTTRPHTCQELENKLGAFSYNLQAFSRDDQKDFLMKFWKTGLRENNFNNEHQESLETHAEAVIHLLTRSISPRMTEFTGVPLQTRMVAEIYPYDIKYLEENQPKLPDKINIVDLYEKFFSKKYRVYFTEKQRGDLTNLAYADSCERERRESMIVHQKFALDALMNESTVRKLLISQPAVEDAIKRFGGENEAAARVGIITFDVKRQPHFVHRTFAEYLAAEFLTVTLKDNSRNEDLRQFFLTELFVLKQYETIRAFMSDLLSPNIVNIAKVIEPKSWYLEKLQIPTEHNRTLYHIAATEGNIEIIRFFLNCLRECRTGNSEKQVANIDIVDWFGHSPLSLAFNRGQDLDVLKCLVKGGATVYVTELEYAVRAPANLAALKYLVTKGLDINRTFALGGTLLHMAANSVGNKEIVQYLCDKSSDINSKDYFGSTPLLLAAGAEDNLDVVKCLVERKARIEDQDWRNETPLHYAMGHENLDMFKYLCVKGADLSKHDSRGLTPLHYFTLAEKPDMIEYLCARGADVNCQTILTSHEIIGSRGVPLEFINDEKCYEDGEHTLCPNIPDKYLERDNSISIFGISKPYWILAECRSDYRTDKGWTPLHFAAKTRVWDIYELLLKLGANPNIVNARGETPLSIAKSKCSYWGDYTEKFIRNRSNVNASL